MVPNGLEIGHHELRRVEDVLPVLQTPQRDGVHYSPPDPPPRQRVRVVVHGRLGGGVSWAG